MNLVKKFSLGALVISGILLTGCSAPSTTLYFSPASPVGSASFNTLNQNAIVNVMTQDVRAQAEISSYTENGNLIKLSASPALQQLFQQVMQQDLNAKGFRLANNGANTKVLVMIKDFYAKVDEGNLRYKISSRIQLEVLVEGAQGRFTKNIGASRVDEGALGVNNKNIQKSLDATLKEVISSLYKDREIADAINRYL